LVGVGKTGVPGIGIVVVPLIFVGALAGVAALKKIPQKGFNITVQILAMLAALKLALSAFVG
jgi:uncharacterized membrane protein YfcA